VTWPDVQPAGHAHGNPAASSAATTTVPERGYAVPVESPAPRNAAPLTWPLWSWITRAMSLSTAAIDAVFVAVDGLLAGDSTETTTTEPAAHEAYCAAGAIERCRIGWTPPGCERHWRISSERD
jgi:hypothetical protein